MEQLKNLNNMLNKKYKALIFDFDGTLFDTAELNFKAYRLAYFDLGIEITEEMFERTKGLSVYQFNNALGVECDVERLRELKSRYYSQMSIYASPNNYLINIIRNSNIPVALVTTARRCNIQPLLNKYGIEDSFCAIITQEDVENYKPSPDAYLLALNIISKTSGDYKILPSEVLAFEDSRAGFVAARQSGCDCVKIGVFQPDCIVDMTGGSNSKTKLIYRNNQLLVKKIATEKVAIEKLTKEFIFLKDNSDKYLIPVSEFDCVSDKDCAYYVMPYVFGGSFYEYQNKIGMFNEVIRRIAEFDLSDSFKIVDNKIDIRENAFNLYIASGSTFYKKYSYGETHNVQNYLSIIPEFVNDFRITRYHGDTTFENIIMSRMLGPILIDPVPYGNTFQGIAHDFSKLGQSLCGYEAIRDGKKFDYRIERKIFDEQARKYLTESEYKSLKFLTACLFFRRLKYQVIQNPSLVKVYGDIGFKLLKEFFHKEYSWI